MLGTEVNLDSTLTVSTDEGPNQYELKGVVYFFVSHFTARVIRKDDMVWFHDGLETRLEYNGLYHDRTVQYLLEAQSRPGGVSTTPGRIDRLGVARKSSANILSDSSSQNRCIDENDYQ